jgi:hypothetical protein
MPVYQAQDHPEDSTGSDKPVTIYFAMEIACASPFFAGHDRAQFRQRSFFLIQAGSPDMRFAIGQHRMRRPLAPPMRLR